VWPDRRSKLGKKYTGAYNLCVAWIIRIDIFTCPPLFFTGSQKERNFAPFFDPTRIPNFRALWFKNGTKKTKIENNMYRDVWAVIWRRLRAARAPKLWYPLAQLGTLKCNNWKNGYVALTQPHVDRLRSNFARWYSVAPWRLQNCQKPT